MTFCSYTVFPKRAEYVNSFSMRHDEDNELLSDAIHVVYVELSKLNEIMKKSIGEMTDLEKWAVFFEYASEPVYRETVNNVIESKEALQMAGDLLMGISKNEHERAAFRSRRMYQTDLESNLATAEDRGEKRKALAIAKNLLAMNLPLSQISMATGLACDEIQSLTDSI